MNQISKTSGEAPVRILIVDDHPNTATMLARAIAQIGPKVEAISATSGREALECVNSGAADILITDMIMPEMNGLELLEKLQTHPAGRPAHVILITAYDVPGLNETARRLKVDQIIVKPVRPERICQIINQVLEQWKQVKAPVPKEQSGGKAFKILVADDRPDNITLLTRYLENEGYAYVTAADGVEALENTRAELPDLILLDIDMPRKDGFAVLEELRADPAVQHIPVIILTAARPDPSDVQSGLNLGADDYVIKPFDRRELMARIRTKLRVKEAEDAMRRRNRELSMLLEVTGMLNSRGEPEKMLEDVLPLIVGRLGASSGYYLNFGTSIHLSFPTSAPEIDPRPIRNFLSTGSHPEETYILDSTQADNFWLSQPEEAIHSMLLATISDRHDELVGAILLTNGQPDYFNPEQIPILRAISNQIAVTLENAAWYSSLRKIPQ